MRSFSEYGAHVQTLFLLALMVLFLLQLYLQNLHYNYKEKIRLALNCLPMIAAMVGLAHPSCCSTTPPAGVRRTR